MGLYPGQGFQMIPYYPAAPVDPANVIIAVPAVHGDEDSSVPDEDESQNSQMEEQDMLDYIDHLEKLLNLRQQLSGAKNVTLQQKTSF